MCGSKWADPLGLTKTKIGDPLGLTKTKAGDPLNLLGNRDKKPEGIKPAPARERGTANVSGLHIAGGPTSSGLNIY